MSRRVKVPRLPKLCGADVELGNFVLGVERPEGTGAEASRALLREIDGVAGTAAQAPCTCPACRARLQPSDGEDDAVREPAAPDPQDWGRKFLASNGGCVYIDLDHLELCLPEVLSAYDHVACWHAMLRIAQTALAAANARQPAGRKLQVLVNNSDGGGNSYGSHLSFLVTRRAFDDIFHRKLHHMAYLAAYQASSIVFTGQGKVGSENGALPVSYQLSQRADFFETVTGVQTTFRRPLVNSRDEPLCGGAASLDGQGDGARPGAGMARLHVIFFDNTLCPVASLLKVGVMQIVLAMLEAGRVDPALTLDDPLAAVARWSHDSRLGARAALTSGRELTAVELQLLFCEQARSFVEDGGCEGLVPRAPEILALWEDTLQKLHAKNLEALAPRLDWVLKLTLLERAQNGRRGLGWESPEMKHLDHLYSSLDPAEGLYWALAGNGFVEDVVGEEKVARFVREPPEDTRAWGRTALLRSVGRGAIASVDWDCLRLKTGANGSGVDYRSVELPNPLASTRAELEPALRRASTLDDVLDAIEAPPAARRAAARRRKRGGADETS